MVTARRRLGDVGESIAAHLLSERGFVICERNVRTISGEIDILARDGKEIAFVEVRTRRSTLGIAAASVGSVKRRRMRRCALEYCIEKEIDPDSARLDVVAIDLPGGHRPAAAQY